MRLTMMFLSAMVLLALDTANVFARGLERVSVRASVSTATARVRAWTTSRPTPVRSFVSGVVSGVKERQPARTLAARVFAPRGGCYGTAMGVSATVRVGLPMPAAEAPSVAVPPEVGGPLLDAIQKRRVGKQLERALRTSSSPVAAKTLATPGALSALTEKAFNDLTKETLKVGGTVSRIGDGTLFDRFIAALPQLLDAAERIMRLLGYL